MDATVLELEDAATAYLQTRPRLLEIAHRILKNGADAEDVVQEAWLRWQATDRSVVLSPTAFLMTTTARLALNAAQSARIRHETYADPALLDREDPATGPQPRAERNEAVESAVMLLLEKLSPVERASFVLREAFDYPYERIARIVRVTPVNARQVVRRSHKKITLKRRRPVAPNVHRRFVQAFRAASDAGNVALLERVFAADLAG